MTEPADSAQTQPLPAVSVTEVIPPLEQPAPPKKKRRLRGWLIALAIIIVLLVVGFFVGESFAKQFAIGYVRDRIVEVLKLDPKTPVDVDLGDGSVILQAISGSIDTVTVDIPKLTIGDLTGQARLTAAGVPLNGSEPVEKLGIEVTVSEENVRKLAGFLSGIELESIELGDGVITVGTEFNILNIVVVPVAVDLLPAAADGGISFEPQTILLGKDQISVADLRNGPFSGLASQLLQSQTFCVASYLPTALTIEDVDVVGSNLVVAINGDGTALSDPALSTVGVCPPAK